MNAVILAGGKGTRLGELGLKIPKPMARIGEVPALEHQVRLLRRYGIKDIIMITGYLSGVIEEYFGDGSQFGVKIEYFVEEEALGTAGGIKVIEDRLTTDVIVLYGDIMLDVNICKLLDFHKNKNGVGTLVLHPNDHPYDSDLVEVDREQKIIDFHPKPHKKGKFFKNLVNAGVYVISYSILKYIEKGTKSDFGKDVYPKVVRQECLYGYTTAEYIKDIGTPDRLEEVNRDYLTGKIGRLNNENPRPAIFLDRDGVINEKVGLLHNIRDFKLLADATKAIRKINDSEFLSIVVTNQSVVARNLCTIEELEEIHKKMDTLLGRKRAKLDGVYYCPHHPDKGYPEENPKYKIKCDCRKPNTGMITKAREDFNIDLERSFLIGDSFNDIVCGRNAGVTTIGVRTGDGCRDIGAEPDYFFGNLLEAVDFIIEAPYEPFFTEIKDRFSKSAMRPFIVSIGGNSRSGKTIFAQYITQKFRKAGCKVSLISLDNWLLPKEARKKEHNVYQRFQIDKIHSDISNLLDGKKIVLKKYDCLSRTMAESKVVYKLQDQQVLMIDGIVALGTEFLRKISDVKVFCEIDEELFYGRLRDFYLWKGLDEEQIRELITSRKTDEYDLIKKDKAFADIIIKTK